MIANRDASLNEQIAAMEGQLLRRRTQIVSNAKALKRAFWQRIASPGMVIAGVCVGVALGRNKPRRYWSVLTVLNAINTCATLLVAVSSSTAHMRGEPREPLNKVYFRHGRVGAHSGSIANLQHIRDVPPHAPPCPDENIHLFRASLDQ